MTRGHEERKVVEAIPVGTPDDRADDLHGGRNTDENEDLNADGRRLKCQGSAKEEPRRA